MPARAGTAVGRLLGTHPDLADRLDGDATTALVAVAGASRSLARVLEADPEALDVLIDLDHRAEEDAADGPGLLAWKRRELLRIAARDLTGRDAVDATAGALARLGDDVLAGAVRLAGAEGLAVIGMGKLGGGELNYASDIDLLFVGEGDPDALARDARRVLELARPCFRMDADLRPEGRDGPLVRSVASYARPLAALGPAVGAPGPAEGPTCRRQPRARAGLGRSCVRGVVVPARGRRRHPGRP